MLFRAINRINHLEDVGQNLDKKWLSCGFGLSEFQPKRAVHERVLLSFLNKTTLSVFSSCNGFLLRHRHLASAQKGHSKRMSVVGVGGGGWPNSDLTNGDRMNLVL